MVEITPEYMRGLFIDGLIGTKEFRNWLAEVDQNFKTVRDSDVDNEIDRMARQRAEALRQQYEPTTEENN